MFGLTKQQIILIAAIIVAIIYGAYQFLFSTDKKITLQDPSKKTAELQSFVNDLTTSMTQDKSMAFYAVVSAKAETEWNNNPFYDKKLYKSLISAKDKASAGSQDVITSQPEGFAYTGYIQIDQKRMAVINGVEYAVGEALETPGFVLGNIYPTKVVIINKEERTKIEVPLQE